MNNTQFGYIHDDPKDEDYVFGAVTGIADYGTPVNPSGQWDRYLPDSELQRKNGVETYSCVTFSLLNCIETLFKAAYGGQYDYAERYIASLSGTTRSGNSPRTVADTVRADGLIPDALLPFDDSIRSFEDFIAPVPSKCIIEGAGWLNKWVFKYEKVIPNEPADMIKALQYSPLQVSVRAWQQDENGLYVADPDEQHNHATMIYGFMLGKWWYVFDSYDNTRKKLAWNYPFKQVMRFHIEPNTHQPSNWFVEILRNLLKLFKV